MKLKRYSDFLMKMPINENLDRSKKFLKERELLKKAANQLGFINDEITWKIKEGEKRTIMLSDFTSEQQEELKTKLREMRLSDDEVKRIERDPEFIKIKEILSSNIGFLYNFVYMYYVEMVPIEGPGGIEDLYKRVLENKALLDKMPKKFDANFIDTTLPNASDGRNNAEVLEDGLSSLKDYKLTQKVLVTLPKKLRDEYKSAPELIKQQFDNVAKGFDEIPSDKKEKVWRTFFGEMRMDTRPTKEDGSPNPNFGKSVYMSSLIRFVNMQNPLREFIKAAKNHLESSTNEGYSDRIELIEEANRIYGNSGANIVYDNKGILIIEVLSFAANTFLNGHTSHCIKDSIYQWNSYVGNHDNRQYYIYNLNLPSYDNKSTIGVTIEPGQRIRAAHDKPDGSISGTLKDILKKWQKEYDIEDNLFSYLEPISPEELERRKRAKIAEQEIVKKGISMEQIKKYVTEDGANINKQEAKVLSNAVEEGDYEKAKFCLALGALPNLSGPSKSPIINAKSLDMIKLLVEYGSEVPPEIFPNIADNTETVEFCLKAGLDPNYDNGKFFRICAKGNWVSRNDMGQSYFDTFKMLVKYGGTFIDTRGRNIVLKWSCEYARFEILEYLEELGYFDKIEENDWKEARAWISHARKVPEETKEKVLKYIDSKSGG